MTLQPYNLSPANVKLNILLYGFPGVGKTSLIGQAQDVPEMRNVGVINFEGGLLSIAHRKDVIAWDVKSLKDVEEILWMFADKEKHPEISTISTLAIDSGTELQTMILSEIVEQAITKKPRNKDGSLRTRDQVYLEDYGQLTATCKRIFRMIRDLPVHTIITALTRSEKNDSDVIVSVGPQFGPVVQEAVMGYQDFVWCLSVDKEGKRSMLTQPRGVYKAKTRGRFFAEKLGVIVPDPDLARIYNLLQETEGM